MKKDYYVVAYDIADTKRRNKVHKFLKTWGEPVNLSVFECEFDKNKFPEIRKEILKLINRKTDIIIYYPLCLNCLSSIINDGVKIQRYLDKTLLCI